MSQTFVEIILIGIFPKQKKNNISEVIGQVEKILKHIAIIICYVIFHVLFIYFIIYFRILCQLHKVNGK